MHCSLGILRKCEDLLDLISDIIFLLLPILCICHCCNLGALKGDEMFLNFASKVHFLIDAESIYINMSIEIIILSNFAYVDSFIWWTFITCFFNLSL